MIRRTPNGQSYKNLGNKIKDDINSIRLQPKEQNKYSWVYAFIYTIAFSYQYKPVYYIWIFTQLTLEQHGC